MLANADFIRAVRVLLEQLHEVTDQGRRLDQDAAILAELSLAGVKIAAILTAIDCDLADGP